MSDPWTIDRIRLRAGDRGPVQVIDREDGPSGRIVCVIPGHLVWQASPDSELQLLDEIDVESAKLIQVAPQLRAVLAALIEWSAMMGGWDTRPWQDARALLDRLRDPHAGP